MRYSPADFGKEIRAARKRLKVTQPALALASGVGIRFIVDLEKGKPTCQLGKVLAVVNTLGIDLRMIMPEASEE